MTLCTPNLRSKHADPPVKNRVVGSRHLAANRVRQNHPQPPETTSENTPTLTITVSGLSVWPSRDPIGEYGGLNVYGFVGNGPVGGIDLLGLLDCDAAKQRLTTVFRIRSKNLYAAIQKCDQSRLSDAGVDLDPGQRLLAVGGLTYLADLLNNTHAASEADDLFTLADRLLEGGSKSRSYAVSPKGLKAAGRGLAVLSVAWDTHNLAAGLGEGDYAKAGQSGASMGLTGLAFFPVVGPPAAAGAGLFLVAQDVLQDRGLRRQQAKFDKEACDDAIRRYGLAQDILNEELPKYRKCCK